MEKLLLELVRRVFSYYKIRKAVVYVCYHEKKQTDIGVPTYYCKVSL